jgi:transposase
MCYHVVTMHIDTCTTGPYIRHLLRTSYREGGKVRHRTVANLSACTTEEIEAMRLALRYKGELTELVSVREDVMLQQGPSVGAVWLVYQVAKGLGIEEALGKTREGKLGMWQVIARVIEQGSRLSAVRMAGSHGACEVVRLEEGFTEDDLYENLDWLSEEQGRIEEGLCRAREGSAATGGLFLYDVTSAYLEGECNELGAFGYNRDKKKGKRQIVVGLLCDGEGRPLSIEVFRGNTQDPKTVGSQIRKMVGRFGGGEVTLVGDRGMLRSRQTGELHEEGFHYITAITKPQIEALLKRGIIQLELFENEVAEVEDEVEGVRYVLRRNGERAKEVRKSREDKVRAVRKEVAERNAYLWGHRRAKPEVALKKVRRRIEHLKIGTWVKADAAGREIRLEEDDEIRGEVEKLDGCYVVKTDLTREMATKEVVHDRYRDLALVEWAFRTSKTVQLEMRPVYVRRESRTRGHAFVVMLAYMVVHELAKRWRHLDQTVEEGIKELETVCGMEMLVKGKPCCVKIPRPRESGDALLKAAGVTLPEALPSRGIRVATRKKLTERRKAL